MTREPVAESSPVSGSVLGIPGWTGGAIALLLLAFAACAYGPSLSLPFMGDDYVFLDRTRDASFLQLWSFQNTDFGWYRPWSRELHFWMLERLVGLNEVAFRLCGLLLWTLALWLYRGLVAGIALPRTSGLALIGAAAMALWGTPLLWISGSQDLWMLVLGLLALRLYSHDRRQLALLPYLAALASKETSAVLPGILFAYSWTIAGRHWKGALRNVLPFIGLTLIWFFVHPTLMTRLLHPSTDSPELVEHKPATVIVVARTLLSVLNSDVMPKPAELSTQSLALIVGSTLSLLAATWVVLHLPRTSKTEPSLRSGDTRVLAFGALWAAFGWTPLLLPSIGWHAYYGCLGALGAWIILSQWLSRSNWIALLVILVVGVLRGLHAETPSWDWGNEWYQRRAGAFLRTIRQDLLEQVPVVAPHTRFFFGHIPNNIGLVAGSSPALRVWYREASLEAGFYSYFRPRRPGTPEGEDLFFRFDTTAGLVPVRTGQENLDSATAANPAWERDHEALAMLFLKSGASQQAGEEFQKLAELAHRPDALVLSAAAFRSIGRTARADSLLSRAEGRLGMPRAELDRWTEDLIRKMPR